MKVLLRAIALWTGATVLVSGLLLTHLFGRASSAYTWALLAALAVTIPLGAYAALQLWRLRHGGRYATAMLVGFWTAVSLVGAPLRQSISVVGVLWLATMLALIGAVLCPPAKRACS